MTDRPTPRRERRDKTPEQALAALMRLCARAEKSSGDALRLMRTWGVAEEARREVLRKLTAQGFIDDARYAGAFGREKIRLAGWGARKIRTALRAKGVADAAIDAALAETDDPEGRGARLRTRLERKLRTVRAADPYDLRNKLLRHALSLGYDYAESAAAVAELTETPEIPCDDF